MSEKNKSADSQNSAEQNDQQDVVDLSGYDTNSNESPDAESENLKADLEKAKNDYLYLRADFDNYKRGAIKERSDLVKYGCERMVVDLLNILDTFEHALAMEITPENMASFKSGIEMLQSEFQNTLNRHGVRSVDSLGQPFDPNVHEALSSEPTSEFPNGHVSKVFKKAYKLHDRLIRPAQVVVATEPKEPQEPPVSE